MYKYKPTYKLQDFNFYVHNILTETNQVKFDGKFYFY